MLEDPTQAMPSFMRLELKPGVEYMPPATGAAPLPNRPARIAALLRAFERHQLHLDALRAFTRPVLYTRGSLSADRYERSAKRLARIFPDFREIVFEGLHHFNTSNQAEPGASPHCSSTSGASGRQACHEPLPAVPGDSRSPNAWRKRPEVVSRRRAKGASVHRRDGDRDDLLRQAIELPGGEHDRLDTVGLEVVRVRSHRPDRGSGRNRCRAPT